MVTIPAWIIGWTLIPISFAFVALCGIIVWKIITDN